MSIEPSNAYTVQTGRVMPPKPAPVMPQPKLSMVEEARLVRARFTRTWGPCKTQPTEGENLRRKQEADAIRDALAAKALKFMARREVTSGEMREAFGVSENQMRNALGLLREQGLASFFRVGQRTVWRKTGSKQSQAKPVTVRGEVFPSMSACARHFGISVQAVADRIRRGATDTIVMRQEAAE